MQTIPLPAQMVKGRDTPVTAYKTLTWLRPPVPSRTRRRGPEPLAHRNDDLDGGLMNDSLAALAMRGVRKTFEAENAPVRALRGVDLTVAGGEFVALMGPSGCGKSTLLNLVAGLDVADEGEITWPASR